MRSLSCVLSSACVAFALVGPATAETPARKDAFGDPLPDGALLRLGTARFWTGPIPGTVRLSPDGKIIAVGNPGDTIRLLDAADGSEIRHLKLDQSGPTVTAFSPAADMIAASSFTGSICLWDTATGKQLGHIDGKGNPVQALVFSADGKTLIVARQNLNQKGVVVTYTVQDSQEIRSYELVHNYPIRLAPSPDGKTLASWGSVQFRESNNPVESEKLSRTVQIWDAAGGKEVRRIETDCGAVACAMFSPDGKTLALTAGAGTIQLWNPTAGALLRTIQGRRAYDPSLVFAPDGKTLYSAGGNGKIQAWEVESGRRLPLPEGPTGRLSSVAFTRGGKLLACSQDDEQAVVWEGASGKTTASGAGHAASVGAVAFAADGKTLWSAGADGALLEWDAATGDQLRRQRMEFTDHDDRLQNKYHRNRFLLSPDARYLLSSGYPNQQILDMRTTADGKEVFAFSALFKPDFFDGFPAAFSADGSLMAAAERPWPLTGGATIHLWHPGSGRERFTLKDWPREPAGLAISPDGKTLAVAAGASPPGPRSAPAEVSVWPIGDKQGPRNLKQLAAPKGGRWEGADLQSLTYAPDGRVLAAVDRGGRLAVWDAATGADRWRTPPAMGNDVVAAPAVFSPDGRLLAAASWPQPQSWEEGKIRLWEVASGKVRREFAGRFGPVASLAFSPDGKMLATGCQDTTILLWDATGTQTAGPELKKQLKAGELDALWSTLATADAAVADRAIAQLAAVPTDAVPYLKKRVPRVETKSVDEAALAKLVAALNADDFDARDKAQRELAEIGPAVAPALRKALVGDPPAELKRRAGELLDKLDKPDLSPDALRLRRAVEALERAATPDARDCLEALSKGRPDADVTEDARAALGRMLKRPAPDRSNDRVPDR